MAMYRCSRCEEFKDGDWNTCVEDPLDISGLMCEECEEAASEALEDS